MSAMMTKDEIARDKLDTLIRKLRKAEEQKALAVKQHQHTAQQLKVSTADVILIENEIADVVRKELPGAAKALRRNGVKRRHNGED